MAIIPDGIRFIGMTESVDLKERKSAQINRKTEPYTMTDIIDTVSAGIVTGAEVNPSSTFLPINESDAFIDSPIFAQHSFGSEGFTLLQTKVNGLDELPVGGISASPSWGISAELNNDTNIQRVQLGDFDGYTNTGKFEWSTGGNAPFSASYIKFDTYGYDLFESTVGYFKLDAKTDNPSNVDGLLYNFDSGFLGFGRGLDVNTRSSFAASIVWDIFTGIFKIKGVFSDDILVSDSGAGLTFIAENSSRIGLNSGAMYISNDLAVTTTVSGSYTKVLHVIDASGNSYGIKLHTY
jgi:hypothetical protein